MSVAELDAQLIRLQSELLDHSGHVRRGVRRDASYALVDEINQIRSELGWRLLDMKGRWKR